jgi:hypothetical protein
VKASPELQVEFADILGDGSVLSQKQRLGNALRKQEDRVWGDLRIIRSDQKTGRGSLLYRLAPRHEQGAGAE